MQEGVKIVFLPWVWVAGECQETEVVKRRVVFVVFWDEFVGEGGAATDDDDAAVGEDLV